MPLITEIEIRAALLKLGPLLAYETLIAQNDALLRGADLDNGRALAQARTLIHTTLVAEWAQEQQRAFGYEKPFAVVAIGGTGRGEMTPCSDTDFALLLDDVIEGNPFVSHLMPQLVHRGPFELEHGFQCGAQPFNLEHAPGLDDKQLNAFLDMRAVYDPHGLTGQFRDRIRKTYDPFEHFLHVHHFWKEHWEREASDCERLDRFDVKQDGLRVFLAGIWVLGGKGFLHSDDIHATLEDRRDLQAYDFLLRIRSFIHLRRSTHSEPTLTGHHEEDVLGFEDFTSFGELLGPNTTEEERFTFASDVRARLLSARRRVARFTRGVMGRELQQGRHIRPESAIVYGVGGLRHTAPDLCLFPEEKSRAAMSLLLASQHYGVPIDPSELEATFANAGDWLQPVPEFSALFYEQRGSLASSFEFLSQLDGAEDRLFPGYAKYEASIDKRVFEERKSLRGTLERSKERALEHFCRDGKAALVDAVSASNLTDPMNAVSIPVEAALLDPDHVAAIKLALKTKRLPVTPDDERIRQDVTRPLHERFSTGLSGIPMDEYYERYVPACDFTVETLRMTRFLLANRRTLKELTADGINDDEKVTQFVTLCQDEATMRALFVFTCADRVEWESAAQQPSRWFNIRELYFKGRMRFRPEIDLTRAITKAGYSRDELAILQDFGMDFFAGVYREYAIRFGSHLVKLAATGEVPGPKVGMLRDGTSIILGVAARDYQGLAACISGACWHHGIALDQAHLFSAMHHGLALDFFHLAPGVKAPGPDLLRSIEAAISQRLYTGEHDLSAVPREVTNLTLIHSRPGLYCLRGETTGDVGALIYRLTHQVYRHFGGNVFGVTAHTGRGGAYVSVYHTMPVGLYLDSARQIMRERF